MWECTDDIQGQRKIRITKNGTLNIYIAVDISESIDKEHVDNAKEAILKLITKVSGRFSCLYQNMMLGEKPIPDKKTVVWKFCDPPLHKWSELAESAASNKGLRGENIWLNYSRCGLRIQMLALN